MTLLTYNKICILFGCRWGWTFFFFFSLFQAVISQTQKLLLRRDLEIISFFCMLCFHVLARLSVARHSLPTLHCVFLLASRLVQGNQKISLPGLSTSSIFYDPSICNLMVAEFPLPKLTLGKVPLDCFETHGQLLLSSLRPVLSFRQHSLYITLCVVAKWADVGEWALQSSN